MGGKGAGCREGPWLLLHLLELHDCKNVGHAVVFVVYSYKPYFPCFILFLCSVSELQRRPDRGDKHLPRVSQNNRSHYESGIGKQWQTMANREKQKSVNKIIFPVSFKHRSRRLSENKKKIFRGTDKQIFKREATSSDYFVFPSVHVYSSSEHLLIHGAWMLFCVGDIRIFRRGILLFCTTVITIFRFVRRHAD